MPIIRRVGRPGLLGMAARTAVVAGTATAVSGAVSSHQRERAAEHQAAEQLAQQQYALQQAAPAPAAPAPAAAPAAPAPAAATDLVARLQQLGDLQAQGLLTAEEFALAKQKLLGG